MANKTQAKKVEEKKFDLKNLKTKLFETVNPVLGYSIFGGAVALCLVIGIVVCLLV